MSDLRAERDAALAETAFEKQERQDVERQRAEMSLRLAEARNDLVEMKNERDELLYDHEPERLTPEETQETAARLGREPQPVRGSRLT